MPSPPEPVMVEVAPELLAELGEWSEAVQIRIEALPDGQFTMIARRHDCEKECADALAE
jgi:hypothetical protein